jgi:hypothetical protein
VLCGDDILRELPLLITILDLTQLLGGQSAAKPLQQQKVGDVLYQNSASISFFGKACCHCEPPMDHTQSQQPLDLQDTVQPHKREPEVNATRACPTGGSILECMFSLQPQDQLIAVLDQVLSGGEWNGVLEMLPPYPPSGAYLKCSNTTGLLS